MKIKITLIPIIVLIVSTLVLTCLTSCNQTPKIEAPKVRTISLKAGLVYKLGVQPVARTKFYLLKDDLKSLNEDKSKGIIGNPYLSPLSVKALTGVGIENLQVGINEDSIKNFIVVTTTTDFEGNGKFENIQPGIYYLSGFTRTRSEDGYALWSVKVDTEKDKETILLDQNNAFEAKN